MYDVNIKLINDTALQTKRPESKAFWDEIYKHARIALGISRLTVKRLLENGSLWDLV